MKRFRFKTILPLVPLLVLYMVIVSVFSADEIVADEGRHMEYAYNLTQGYYTDAENPAIRNGPGYPLVMAPFVKLGIPNIVIKLLNGIFLFIAVIYFFLIISRYLSPKRAIAITYLFGLYPPLLKWISLMHSEALAVLLVCGFLYYFLKVFDRSAKRARYIVLSSFFLGYLTLTKVIFGYVILASILFYLVVFLIGKSEKIKRTLIVLVGAFVMCIPYLYHTYSLTGKLFYWGTQGGEVLYWRSTPFSKEYGDWISSGVVLNTSEHDYYDTSEVVKNHGAFFKSLEPYSAVERDALFKAKSIENMKEYPLKYIKNTSASALRLFFNYPYSYTTQKTSTYFYIFPNALLVTFLSIAIVLALRNLRAILFEIRFLGVISLLFIGGLVLLDGRVRHLIPILPLLLVFMVYIFKHLVVLSIKKVNEEVI